MWKAKEKPSLTRIYVFSGEEEVFSLCPHKLGQYVSALLESKDLPSLWDELLIVRADLWEEGKIKKSQSKGEKWL